MKAAFMIILVLSLGSCDLRKCATRPPDVLVQLDFSQQDSSYLEFLSWELTASDGAEFPYEIRNFSDSLISLFQVTLILVTESNEYYLDYGNEDVDTLRVLVHEETAGCDHIVIDLVEMNGDLLTMNTDSSYFYQKKP